MVNFFHARPGWDAYFLNIADAVSHRAECRRSRVGCVIVRDNRIISTGYNGVEAGEPSCLDGVCPRGLLSYEEQPALGDYASGAGKCIATHAEHNAVLDAECREIDLSWSVAYVTRETCDGCREKLSRAGVGRVVWMEGGVTHAVDLSGPTG